MPVCKDLVPALEVIPGRVSGRCHGGAPVRETVRPGRGRRLQTESKMRAAQGQFKPYSRGLER